ncbi:sigma-70 family RNA polymerase sigma factor [Paenibacillus tyrfis]|uniref:sigma-70 family RNA polymerase sigma factor n=1 Tax=Paenibacillus tyrfis TaxID=1501230 RepID=UPI00209E6A86|nr:sigma-70 family RNA polymerase sigma factor [Paenibacillus tyrfis]MCP1307367.1 sigma-70 family RNA polymerase sigma factor [Paenibacillus tyrfis]
MNRSDRVREAQSGNHAAFLALIEEQQDRLRRIAYYYVRQDMDAEDVVHEAIYKALVGLPKLKQPQFFATWLTRIVINCALTALDKRQRLVPDDSRAAERQPALVPDPDDRLDLRSAVRQLEPKQRQVITFKYWHDMTIEEIAVLLRKPIGTVKTILHRGLKELRKRYDNPDEPAGSSLSPSAGASELSGEEALQHKLAELKLRTEELFDIPEAYELTIADYHEDKREGGRAMFVWTKAGEDPIWSKSGKDSGLSVELNAQGDLVEYTIDVEEAASDLPELSVEQLRLKAEKFVLDHYPGALKPFSLTRTKSADSGTLFFYEQEIMGLPLPLSGFRVKVHRSGIVSDFRYFGRQTKPKVPEFIVPKERLLRQISDTAKLDLRLDFLHKSVDDTEKDELRLVYEPRTRWMLFRADGTEEAREAADEDTESEEPAIWLPVPERPAVEAPAVQTAQDAQELLGIDPDRYELLREVEMDDRMTGIVWRRRDWQPMSSEDRSLDAFFRQRSEETLKAKIDPVGGRLVSFIRFEEEAPGELRLSREECLDIALRFLDRMSPGLAPFLQLRQQEEVSDSDREHFDFRIGKQGVWLELEHIRISVNKTSGQIGHVTGPSVDPAQLRAVEVTPLMDEAEARRIYAEALDLKLGWETDYSANGKRRRYRLMYRLVHKEKGREIRWIDARTGELICSKLD